MSLTVEELEAAERAARAFPPGHGEEFIVVPVELIEQHPDLPEETKDSPETLDWIEAHPELLRDGCW